MSKESQAQHRHRMDRKHKRSAALKVERDELLARLVKAHKDAGLPDLPAPVGRGIRPSKRSLKELIPLVEQSEDFAKAESKRKREEEIAKLEAVAEAKRAKVVSEALDAAQSKAVA
jgi:hypothetical protein